MLYSWLLSTPITIIIVTGCGVGRGSPSHRRGEYWAQLSRATFLSHLRQFFVAAPIWEITCVLLTNNSLATHRRCWSQHDEPFSLSAIRHWPKIGSWPNKHIKHSGRQSHTSVSNSQVIWLQIHREDSSMWHIAHSDPNSKNESTSTHKTSPQMLHFLLLCHPLSANSESLSAVLIRNISGKPAKPYLSLNFWATWKQNINGPTKQLTGSIDRQVTSNFHRTVPIPWWSLFTDNWPHNAANIPQEVRRGPLQRNVAQLW